MTADYRLTRWLTSYTEQYHDLGHDEILGFRSLPSSDSVNDLIDSAAGRGHRIAEGHDFDGLVDSFQEDGIHGAVTWFDHMLKDFTSPDGIPLPGADLAERLGMSTTEAVDWLCVNAGDAIEAGSVAAVTELLGRRFKDNPRLEQACLLFGGALGVHDDNPLLVGYVVVKTALYLRRRRIVSDRVARVFVRTTRTAGQVVTVTAVSTFGIVTVLLCCGVDVLDILESAGGGLELIDGVEVAGEVAAGVGDLVDGLSTLGASIALSYGVKKLFKYLAKEDREKVEALRPRLAARKSLAAFAEAGAARSLLAQAVESAEAQGVYRRRLCLG